MYRSIYRVQWNGFLQEWHVVNIGGLHCAETETKASAIQYARRLAKNDWSRGQLSQVVVHKKDGTIQTEWTYGRDPERSKG